MTERAPEENAQNLCTPPAGKDHLERNTTMITVLIADRLPAMREHVSKVLNGAIAAGYRALEAADSDQAMQALSTNEPALAIIETTLPGTSGLQVAKALWSRNPNAKILFAFPSYSEVHMRELERIIPPNGVYGLVLKTIKEKELAYAIDCLLVHDNTYVDPQIRAAKNRLAGQECVLSDLELETLQDVALGLTDKAISLRRNISVRGVQSRVASLFAKLIREEDDRTRAAVGVEVINPRARLIFHAIRRGLLDLEKIDNWESEFATWLTKGQSQAPKAKGTIAGPAIQPPAELRLPRPSQYSA